MNARQCVIGNGGQCDKFSGFVRGFRQVGRERQTL